MEQVNYDILDKVKIRCIEASRKTLGFAEKYGFVPSAALGASANVFSLNLAPFLKTGASEIYLTHLPEGLGTADDARPNDLTSEEMIRFWYNIGIKTVSTLTNDAASAGMQTILISLYLPSSTPETVFTDEFLKGFLDGFVDGCKTVGCVYISGETPQLKSKIFADRIDIAGGLFALMPPGHKPITGESLEAGDLMLAVASSGPHENGFTPIRRFVEALPLGWRSKMPSGKEFWEGCNAPSVLYTPLIQALLKEGIRPTNIENITGHGWQKIMRSKKSFRYMINERFPVPEVFQFIEDQGKISKQEMLSIFNYGIGMMLWFKESDAIKAELVAKNLKYTTKIVGKVESSNERTVEIPAFNISLKGSDFALSKV